MCPLHMYAQTYTVTYRQTEMHKAHMHVEARTKETHWHQHVGLWSTETGLWDTNILETEVTWIVVGEQ